MTPIPRRSSRAQAGYSLVEMVVAISIFMIFSSMVTASIVQLTRSAAASETRAASSSVLSNAFQNLDRSIRYASSVNFPGVGGDGSTYIEYWVSPLAAADGQGKCVQWRYNPTAGTLATRSWHSDTDHDGTLGVWQVKASNVQAADAGTPTWKYPFELIPAAGSASQQVVFTLRVGSDAYGAVSRAQTRFVARNSNDTSASNAEIPGSSPPESATPVCNISGYRS